MDASEMDLLQARALQTMLLHQGKSCGLRRSRCPVAATSPWREQRRASLFTAPCPFVFGSKPPIPAAEPVPNDAIPAHKQSPSRLASALSESTFPHGQQQQHAQQGMASEPAPTRNFPSGGPLPEGFSQGMSVKSASHAPAPFVFGQGQQSAGPAAGPSKEQKPDLGTAFPEGPPASSLPPAASKSSPFSSAVPHVSQATGATSAPPGAGAHNGFQDKRFISIISS